MSDSKKSNILDSQNLHLKQCCSFSYSQFFFCETLLAARVCDLFQTWPLDSNGNCVCIFHLQKCSFTSYLSLGFSSTSSKKNIQIYKTQLFWEKISSLTSLHISLESDCFYNSVYSRIFLDSCQIHLGPRIQGQPDPKGKYHQLLFRANLTDNLTSNNNYQVIKFQSHEKMKEPTETQFSLTPLQFPVFLFNQRN